MTGVFNIIDGVVGDTLATDLKLLNTGGSVDSWAWNGTPPPWANLNTSTGVITGTYAEGEWISYSVTATNAQGSDTTNNDSVTVTAVLAAPNLTGLFNIADGSAGVTLNMNLNTLNSGGEAASWAWNGTPPPWANLNVNTGVITGSYAEGSWTGYSVTATNIEGNDTSNTDDVTVTAAADFNPPNGIVGAAYNYTSVGGVTGSYEMVFPQSLPRGLTLNATTGEILGTPILGGLVSFIAIKGSAGKTSYADINITQPVDASTVVDDAYTVTDGTQLVVLVGTGLLANDTIKP